MIGFGHLMKNHFHRNQLLQSHKRVLQAALFSQIIQIGSQFKLFSGAQTKSTPSIAANCSGCNCAASNGSHKSIRIFGQSPFDQSFEFFICFISYRTRINTYISAGFSKVTRSNSSFENSLTIVAVSEN